MGAMGLYSVIYAFILKWPLLMCTDAVFTEVPADVCVGEGEDVEMACAFKAVSSAPMSLEIQWWYVSEELAEELLHEPHINTLTGRAQVGLREATKISTVRVHGNAISHHLSLLKVKKEDAGVYECRVSNSWADQTQEFTVHASLRVVTANGMMAEEAVSHMKKRVPLRNTRPDLGLANDERSGQGIQRGPQQAESGLLPSISSSTFTAQAGSSASPRPACSVANTRDLLLCFILLLLVN